MERHNKNHNNFWFLKENSEHREMQICIFYVISADKVKPSGIKTSEKAEWEKQN